MWEGHGEALKLNLAQLLRLAPPPTHCLCFIYGRKFYVRTHVKYLQLWKFTVKRNCYFHLKVINIKSLKSILTECKFNLAIIIIAAYIFHFFVFSETRGNSPSCLEVSG